MKANRLASIFSREFWAVSSIAFAIAVAADAALTTNSWTQAGDGKWETASNWSAGAPANSNAANLITNATTKTVTIDATTVLSNTANGCLTISNLVLSSPMFSTTTNTLQLINAGTNTPLHILNGFTISSGVGLEVTNAALLVTNSALQVDGGFVINGDMTTLTNAFVTANTTTVGAAGGNGTLWENGGSFVSGLTVKEGAVWLNDGSLVSGGILLPDSGIAQLTVSNGTLLCSGLVRMSRTLGSQGTLTIAGGTALMDTLIAADLGVSGKASVWVTGGQLSVTGTFVSAILLGSAGAGDMTVSNGTVLALNASLGANASSQGTLTIAGGTTTLLGIFNIGNGANSSGSVWVTEGRLLVNDSGTTQASAIGNSGVGQMTVSNGTWVGSVVGSGVVVASGAGSQGTLTIAGGTNAIYSGSLTIGNFACSATGVVNIVGGELDVTNALANATMEVRSGTLTLSGGMLRTDRFVMTNSCGHFVHTGGTLIYGSAVLDPNRDDDGDGIPNGYEQSHGLDPLNPVDAALDNDGDGMSNLQEYLAGTDPTNSASSFHITSIAQVSTNVLVIWMTGPGKTNALECSSGDTDGSYSNNFITIFTVTNTVGTTNNYLDVGAATNSSVRYYRVRLVS